jgi:hypothetical protein
LAVSLTRVLLFLQFTHTVVLKRGSERPAMAGRLDYGTGTDRSAGFSRRAGRAGGAAKSAAKKAERFGEEP